MTTTLEKTQTKGKLQDMTQRPSTIVPVKCQICGAYLGLINDRHLQLHNTTLEVYRKNYPDALTCAPRKLSPETCKKMSDVWNEPGYRERMSKALSEGQKTRPPITEETRHNMEIASQKTGKQRGEILSKRKHTPDEISRMSMSITKAYENPAVRKCLSDAITKVWTTPGYRERLSKALTGRTFEMSSEACKNMSISQTTRWSNLSLDERTQLLESIAGGLRHAWETSGKEWAKHISEGLSRYWRELEAGERSPIHANKPTFPERCLLSLLDVNYPSEWSYEGNGSFIIKGRNPDFRNKTRKILIEVFGDYWHDPELFPDRPTEEELITHYKTNGFDCLVIWEHDVYDDDLCLNKVKEAFYSNIREENNE
jgi:hypothetical protein